jgi:hypothetical protein
MSTVVVAILVSPGFCRARDGSLEGAKPSGKFTTRVVKHFDGTSVIRRVALDSHDQPRSAILIDRAFADLTSLCTKFNRSGKLAGKMEASEAAAAAAVWDGPAFVTLPCRWLQA